MDWKSAELSRFRLPLIASRADEVGKLKARGMGVRAIARPLMMPVSSVYRTLQLAG
jgi:DNA-binding IclR family transcriptional regulator